MKFQIGSAVRTNKVIKNITVTAEFNELSFTQNIPESFHGTVTDKAGALFRVAFPFGADKWIAWIDEDDLEGAGV